MICHIVGARPNFMKAAPVLAFSLDRNTCLQQRPAYPGQHYVRVVETTCWMIY